MSRALGSAAKIRSDETTLLWLRHETGNIDVDTWLGTEVIIIDDNEVDDYDYYVQNKAGHGFYLNEEQLVPRDAIQEVTTFRIHDESFDTRAAAEKFRKETLEARLRGVGLRPDMLRDNATLVREYLETL